MARYFIRCVDCLAVGAVDVPDPKPYEPAVRPGVCPCGGRTESMGRVERARLVHDSIVSACDARCTSARGPSCDCHCGGKNHGSRLVVAIAIDAGPLPRYELSPNRGRALEYRVARREAELRLAALNGDDLVARKLRGAYLSSGDFARYRRIGEGHRRIRKAESGRTHAGRLKSLAAVEPDLAPADCEVPSGPYAALTA